MGRFTEEGRNVQIQKTGERNDRLCEKIQEGESMMKKKRLWAWFMAAVMAIGLLPVTALAEELETPKTTVSTDSDKPIQITKSVSTDADGKHTITMEAYVTDKVTTTTTSKPMDIVLVLDVSGSMKDKMENLQTAVNGFIDKVAENSAEHRISIVKFAGEKTDKVGNDTYWDEYWKEYYNYSQIVRNLTFVTELGKTALESAVSNLKPGGATRADLGLELAKKVLDGGANSDTTRGKVVIMFTDGVPTSASNFDYSVATAAVNKANDLKGDSATIFTIGMFGENGKVPKDDDDFWNDYWTKDRDKYMYAVSSRYPDATAEVTKDRHDDHVNGWNVTHGDKVENDVEYYSTAKDADELNKIFQTISSEILNVKVGVNSKLTDTLTEYFDFGDDVAVDKVGGVTVKKVAKTTTGWDEKNATDITSDVTVKVDGKKIEVTGFDYTSDENIVTDEGGYKLVLTFPIQPNPDADWEKGTYNYPTNKTDADNKAGLYGAKVGNEDHDELLEESPQVPVTAYGVIYDANGGDANKVPTDSKGYLPGTDATVLGKGDLTREGYDFVGWSESPEGTTIVGSTVSIGKADKTLYAIWSKTITRTENVTLTYDGNGGAAVVGSETKIQISQKYGKGYPVIVAENSFTREGYDFVGWSDTADGEAAAQPWSTFTITNDTTLYAIWSKTITRTEDVTLTYDGNGGAAVVGSETKIQISQKYGKGYPVIVAENSFTREGYDFVGWSNTADGEASIQPWSTFTIIEHTILYAIWKQKDAGDVTVTKSVAYEENGYEPGHVYQNEEWVTFKIDVTNNTNDVKDFTLQENPGAGLTNGFWYVWLSGDDENHSNLSSNIAGNLITISEPGVYDVTLDDISDPDRKTVQIKLQPGKTCEIYYRAEVNIREPYNKDDYKNIAVVGDKESEPVYVPVTGIDIMKEVIGNTTVKRGDQVLYKIVVTNPSDFNLIDVKITETPNAKLVDGYFCDQDGTKITENVEGNVYTIGKLKKNEDVTLYYTAKVSNSANDGDKLGNHVVVEATCGDDKVRDERDSDKVTVNVPGNNSSGGGSHRKHTSTKVEEVLNKEDHFQYVQGYPDATVRPDANITRAEATVIFFRLLTDSVREKYLDKENSFTDVNAADWYNIGISTMENGGFVNGYQDGSFRPNGYITRAELATIISNFDDLEPVEESKFPDAAGHWAEAYINSAAEKGWLSGYADGLFRPNQLITRAETMSMINRVLERSVDADGLHRDTKQWQDNLIGKWYYYAVLEATNPHEYERKDTADVERWTAITAEKIWEN